MTLTALLVCVDQSAAKVLRRVLGELSIEAESCPDFPRAAIRLAQDRFDVVIVDGESNAEVVSLLRDTRLSRMNEGTLAIAVVAGQESIREMFSMGVNFVLYKPVAYDRALSSLRAARAVMRKEKRKKGRAPVHTHATVDYANVSQEKATLINLAEDGMAVQFGKKLPPTSKVYFQFRLPGQSASVRLSGQVIWQDWNGRAGVSFVDVPKASRRMLEDFLDANLPREAQPEQLPDVTVEVEEPVAVAAPHHGAPAAAPTRRKHDIAVREVRVREIEESEVEETEIEDGEVETREIQDSKVKAPRETVRARKPVREESVPEGLSVNDSRAEADNRRTKTRYACRLGAEVYRTGTAVPHRCCLTDLSSGGCYLEVALPFPTGSPVEILVRTHDMKLRLRGTIQASHPGFGMGVAFELKSKEELESVRKLTSFVAATTEPS